MTEHLSTNIVERFHQQALVTVDRHVIYDHILACESCRQRIVNARTEVVALQALSDNLLPSSDDEPYHLDYELIEGYVDNKLDRIDRDTAEMHLEVCAECSAEVTDLRESLATMRVASIRQSEKKTTLRERLVSLTQLPTFSPRVYAIVALAAFAVIAVVVVWRLKSGGPRQAPVGGRDLSAGRQPTPNQSPLAPGIANPPLPHPGPSPSQLAGKAPKERFITSDGESLALNDGPNKIALDKSGKIVGLERLPSESQQAVREALLKDTIKKPGVLDEMNVPEISLRGSSGNEERVKLIYPADTVIVEDKPLLEWVPSTTADAYRIEIGDAGFHQVAKSENLPATTRAWTPPAPLKRGIIYTWVLRPMNKDGGSAAFPSQGKFKVLDDQKVKELDRLKATSQSHLALGVFYAREGMVADAEREFQILVQENPRSPVAKKLLKQIHSWHTR